VTGSDERRSVVVVGASAAGLRCACRLNRLEPDRRIRVVDAAEVFSYAACGLPYALSGDVGEPGALRKTDYGVIRDADYFAKFKGVEVTGGHRAVAIDVSRHRLTVEGTDGTEDLPWDDLVVATGAKPIRLPDQPDHPRVVAFHVWEDLEPLKTGLARGEIERVAVIGAGLVGCELAEAFRSLWGAEVTLLEAAGHPLPRNLDPELAGCVSRHLIDNGIRLLTDSPVESIRVDDDKVELTAGGRIIEAQVAVVAVGVAPEVELGRQAGAELGPGGAIVVDSRLATSVPHVFAVGDCATVRHVVTGDLDYMPLGSLATRQGRTLGNLLAGRTDAFPPVAGAVAVKVFDRNIAATGITRTAARERGLTAQTAHVTALDRPHYWPESAQIHLGLVYAVRSGRLLGAQAVGEGDVTKRIDVATQVIARGGTLDDLAHVEHAYAPPYAPALEPLAVAAMVAQNRIDGVASVAPDEAWEEVTVLDVRSPAEAEESPAAHDRVIRIPLSELAERVGELDATIRIVVCARGPRSAEAVRLLERHGIRARYLGGGLRWRESLGEAAGSRRTESVEGT
jgi:NADPH-dependent 2,4-dienoyl-CoA reductase/sulfur reductase-like enzyme/rhodanese-related sulfurtransferase